MILYSIRKYSKDVSSKLFIIWRRTIIVLKKMATFFGEVLPTRSRAVDDDDDDDNFESEEVSSSDSGRASLKNNLQWRPSLTSDDAVKLQCETLVLAVGPLACGFTRLFFGHSERPSQVALYNSKRSDEFSDKIVTREAFVIFQSSAKIILCFHEQLLDAEDNFSAVEQLFTNFNMEQLEIVILCSQSMSNYFHGTSTTNLSPLLRCLKSEQFKGKVAAPYLEQPNTVVGITAAVMTYCQVHSLQSVLYVAFTEVPDMDSLNMNAFTPLLSHFPGEEKNQHNWIPEKIDFLRQKYNVKSGNLYV